MHRPECFFIKTQHYRVLIKKHNITMHRFYVFIKTQHYRVFIKTQHYRVFIKIQHYNVLFL